MLRKVLIGGTAGAGIIGAAYYAQNSPTPSQKQELPKFNLPNRVQYLLIGGGASSFGAYRAIRNTDPKAQVLVVGEESHQPYMKPPLSKELWQGSTQNESFTFKQWNGRERSILFEHPEYFSSIESFKLPENNGGVAFIGGIRAVKVDPLRQAVFFEDGSVVEYDRCLISTGSIGKKHSVLSKTPGIEPFIIDLENIDGFRKLQKDSLTCESILVVGSGPVASEVAVHMNAFAKTNNPKLRVTQVFREAGNIASLLPDYLAKWLSRQMQANGVKVLSGTDIVSAEVVNKRVHLKLSSGSSLTVDRIVLAVGNEPNTMLAEESGLELDEKNGGIVTNANLEVRSNLYAAGDVSSFFDPRLGRRRMESYDHSVMTGKIAGKNMAGKPTAYSKQSMIWSDVGDIVSFEGVGMLEPSLKTFSVFFPESPETSTDFDGPITKGVVFYQNSKGVVVGVLLCNIFGRLDDARKIISEGKVYSDLKSVAKVFYEKFEPAEGEKS